jgi:hypothetical protein
LTAEHPDIRVTLNAASDDFRIVDHVIKALRGAGIPTEEIETFCDEAMSGGDRECFEPAGEG